MEPQVHAATRATRALERADSRAFACDTEGGLPSPLAAFLEAAGQLAGAAAEGGDLAEARRLLEEGLRAVEAADVRRDLRVVAPGDDGGRQ